MKSDDSVLPFEIKKGEDDVSKIARTALFSHHEKSVAETFCISTIY